MTEYQYEGFLMSVLSNSPDFFREFGLCRGDHKLKVNFDEEYAPTVTCEECNKVIEFDKPVFGLNTYRKKPKDI
jgi:hypothetical protein